MLATRTCRWSQDLHHHSFTETKPPNSLRGVEVLAIISHSKAGPKESDTPPLIYSSPQDKDIQASISSIRTTKVQPKVGNSEGDHTIRLRAAAGMEIEADTNTDKCRNRVTVVSSTAIATSRLAIATNITVTALSPRVEAAVVDVVGSLRRPRKFYGCSWRSLGVLICPNFCDEGCHGSLCSPFWQSSIRLLHLMISHCA